MKLIHVKLDDETAHLLAKYPNQSEIIRQSIRMYIEGIQTDTVEGLRAAFKQLLALHKDTDSKIDYIAERLQR